MIAISLFGIVLGMELNRLRRQRLIVAEIERSGPFVEYVCRFTNPFTGGPLYSADWFNEENARPRLSDEIKVFSREYLCNIRIGGGCLNATDDTISILCQLPNQDWLDVTGSGITDVGVKRLAKMKTLVDLSLYETRISDEGLADLASMDNLIQLMVSGTGMTDAGVEHVSRMANVTGLGLGSNGITDASLPSIAKMVNLKGLWLDSAKITDAGIVHLESMSNLAGLYLFNTQISPEGAARLQTALPKCVIKIQSGSPTQ